MTASKFSRQYDLFCNLLVQKRLSRSLTQTELAASLNKPQSFVSKYENGERRIDIVEFLEICRMLRVDPLQCIKQLEGHQMNIFEKWDISVEQLTAIIQENPSLRGMLLGYIAEHKLKEIVYSIPGIETANVKKPNDHDRKNKGDLHIKYNERIFRIESKSLQTNSIAFQKETQTWHGKAQVDASDRREIKLPNGETLQTTLLLKGEFDILAVNCYAFTNEWRFVFAKNQDLPHSTWKKYSVAAQQCLIASLIPVTYPPKYPFCEDITVLLSDVF